jgi:hypothetical protein
MVNKAVNEKEQLEQGAGGGGKKDCVEMLNKARYIFVYIELKRHLLKNVGLAGMRGKFCMYRF